MFITFGSYKNSLPDDNFTIKIADYNLNRVKSCQYLGIYFDQHMRWDIHVSYLIKRVKYLLFVFYKLKHISKKILKIMYYSLFLGVVSYAISVWGFAYTMIKMKIFSAKISWFVKTDISLINYLNK